MHHLQAGNLFGGALADRRRRACQSLNEAMWAVEVTDRSGGAADDLGPDVCLAAPLCRLRLGARGVGADGDRHLAGAVTYITYNARPVRLSGHCPRVLRPNLVEQTVARIKLLKDGGAIDALR